ncbi:MAG: response regulator, partial [Leptolyngbya sp. SIO3F4]|nr:response regulator [Leptolyngbya sp. SIO3F4]
MLGNILLVDDTPQNLELLFEILLNQGYKVRCAISGPLALKAVEAVPPDLILLDINMPDMDGYEVCRKLKESNFFKEIPIIFVSALGETPDKIKAFESGGVDYVTKPFQVNEVLARIATHLQLKKTQSEVKRLNEKLEQRVVERTAQLQEEMTARQHVQEQLIYQATHDELTSFLSLSGFTKVLEEVMVRTKFISETYAVLTLICEQFQRITHAFGHISGDQLLLQIARHLKKHLPAHAVIARVDNDKFVILLEGVSANSAVAQHFIVDIVRHVQAQLAKPFTLEQRDVFVRTKWGITLGQPYYSKADH